MMKNAIVLNLLLILALAGTVGAGEALDAVRAEVVACRSALANEDVIAFRTLNLLAAAQESFTEAIAMLDSGDPGQIAKAFALIGAGMKKMDKAVKSERSQVLADFVLGWEQRLWLAASSVFKAPDIVVGGGQVDPALQKKLTKKMAKASRPMTRGKYASAVKKLSGAFKVQAKIDPDP